MKILIVEDTEGSIRFMERVANHLGHELRIARNATEGLQLVQEQPDIILMDISLPKVDGLTLTRQIRSQLPHIPIIAVTANAMAGDRDRCLQAGCNEYLAKPFHLTEIIALLDRYAGDSR